MHFKKIVLALAAAGFASGAYATNGMNMEAYGPIAGGMGGASFAYDNGTAAMMNNPATLGLMAENSRLDVAVGFLGPDVTAKYSGASSTDSDGDAYFMPAIGYARKNGAFTYGVGVFAQGGMGTEWDAGSFLDPSGGALDQRSELGVGRAILPLTYQATPDLVIGGSIDYVWAMLDLQWAVSGAQFAGFIPAFGGGSSAIGTASGSMVDGLVYAITQQVMPAPSWAYFDFSDGDSGSDAFTGETKATGWAGKLGFVYKVSPTFSVGGTYHSETDLDDLDGDATLSMGIQGMGVIPVTGEIKIKDFQWPETYGIGVSWQASDKLMVAADYKRINWGDVMKDFKMSFKADSVQANPMAAGFGGAELDMTLAQNWDDQDVFQLGLSYKATDALTLRAGASFADNPIPDQQMNPLFPAIVEDHYTVGFGYAFNKVSDVNFSFTYAPEVDQTVSAGGLYAGTKVEHSQTNAQLMYSHRF
jgi:long-chain fatty acid transport protein